MAIAISWAPGRSLLPVFLFLVCYGDFTIHILQYTVFIPSSLRNVLLCGYVKSLHVLECSTIYLNEMSLSTRAACLFARGMTRFSLSLSTYQCVPFNDASAEYSSDLSDDPKRCRFSKMIDPLVLYVSIIKQSGSFLVFSSMKKRFSLCPKSSNRSRIVY